ncbi:hypothetical protein P171DRAFT_497707 [Karstenula rhodostoma CBS 690.94]|uniref:BTB domain-containing protein n=1 Tax=Karstenula rhodostoma CBS 690.94 TaxID=1392251 RepID=A0A9P4U7P7_9PLEO|nr:hypothetical protein P171DRAFT_497707 [Karstenula rhodostoma CBS 690.94]
MDATKAVEKPPNFRAIFCSPTVVVKIGAEGKMYRISKALTMHYSGYFRGAFGSNGFQEGVSGEVTLQHIQPYVLEGFITWLYYHDPETTTSSTWFNKYKRELRDLKPSMSIGCAFVDLYIFADRFIIPKLTAALTTAAVMYYSIGSKNKHHPNPSYETIVYAFAELPQDHTLLRVLADAAYRNWRPSHYKKPSRDDRGWFEQLPAKFLLRQLAGLSLRTSKRGRLRVHDYLEDATPKSGFRRFFSDSSSGSSSEVSSSTDTSSEDDSS